MMAPEMGETSMYCFLILQKGYSRFVPPPILGCSLEMVELLLLTHLVNNFECLLCANVGFMSWIGFRMLRYLILPEVKF